MKRGTGNAERQTVVMPAAVFVIFGGGGDLAKRKLIPALYDLFLEGRLPERFAILGVSRTKRTDHAYRDELKKAVRAFGRLKSLFSEDSWTRFAERLSYAAADYRDAASVRGLSARLTALDTAEKTEGRRLFYLATPPTDVCPLLRALADQKLITKTETPSPWPKVVIEKPFGTDLASAKALSAELARLLDERQIYRIDHYLGKETVQNLLVFRFANGLYEPAWNRMFIDHVELTVSETVGVENRGAYYESAGALRDMVGNHMFQLLSLIAMEPPKTLTSDAIRAEKVRAIRAIRLPDTKDLRASVVRGQYDGYRKEKNVNQDSNVETFVALKLFIGNTRWRGVPFYLRTGKKLSKRASHVSIQFREPKNSLFPGALPNRLVFRIQPCEGVTVEIDAKEPGNTLRLKPVAMTFDYETSFDRPSPDAYERLLLDAWRGDQTLFIRRDMAEASWLFLDAVRGGWSKKPMTYAPGSAGPAAADDLLAKDGRAWHA